jgi:hypothetical protein
MLFVNFFALCAPLVTTLLVSIVLSLALNLFVPSPRCGIIEAPV